MVDNLDWLLFMTFEEYQKEAWALALPQSRNLSYVGWGFVAEVGEFFGKLAKWVRDGVLDKQLVRKEIGDLLWFVSALASYYEFDLQEIADENISKLKDRQQRGVLQGNGDTR